MTRHRSSQAPGSGEVVFTLPTKGSDQSQLFGKDEAPGDHEREDDRGDEGCVLRSRASDPLSGLDGREFGDPPEVLVLAKRARKYFVPWS